MMLKAVYPGTFDPFTYGHRDLIARAVQRFGAEVIVAVVDNRTGGELFSCAERCAMVAGDIADISLEGKVSVRPFSGLLTSFVREVGANFVLRGLRAVSDFEYEFQMVSANQKLDEDFETVFLMASEQHHFISSSVVREIASLGGDVDGFVSQKIAARLRGKFGS